MNSSQLILEKSGLVKAEIIWSLQITPKIEALEVGIAYKLNKFKPGK